MFSLSSESPHRDIDLGHEIFEVTRHSSLP